MPLERARRIIDKLAPEGHLAALLLSGGEPSIHPDFEKIVRHAVGRFRRIVINTNGMFPEKLIGLSALNQPPHVQVSLDGPEEVHDSIRGAGVFAKAARSLSILAESRIGVTISTTVSKSNISSIRQLDVELSSLPFSSWDVKRLVGYGRASDGDDVSTEDWNHLVAVAKNGFRNRIRLHIQPMFTPEAILTRFERSMREEELAELGANCGTGRSKIYVNPNGTVFPCACMEEHILGSLELEEISDIKEKIGTFPLQQSPHSYCQLCPAKERCQGGCPGAALRTELPDFGDPRCPLADAGRSEYASNAVF